MPSSLSTTASSVLFSFAVGVALGACLVVPQKRSRTVENDVCNIIDDTDNDKAKTATTQNTAEDSTSTTPRQFFQSPMTKARSNAPLNTVKKKTTTKTSSSSAATATTPTALSPMTMARQADTPATSSTSSIPTPRVLLSDETTNDKTETKSTQIRLVLQRYGQASLLVQPNETVRVGEETSNFHVGLLVYISFAKTATSAKLLQAAKTVLNLPIITRGVWGDGTGTLSILDMAALQQQNQQQQQGISIMLVPQANLISKVKSLGKSIQYHGQIDKENGQMLYGKFVQYVQALVFQHQCSCRNQTLPKTCATLLKASQQQEKQQIVDASVPPSEMFLLETNKYGSWDDAGMPLTTADGQALTKSATKKLKKQYDAQRKRYEKYSLETPTLDTTTKKPPKDDSSSWLSMLDPNFVQVVPGTFGNLQALEFKSDMGPFCHVIDL